MQIGTRMAIPSRTRSGYTSGRVALVSGRTRSGRRIHDLTEEMLRPIATPTAHQVALAERAAALRHSSELEEMKMASGDPAFQPKLHQRLVSAWMRTTAALDETIREQFKRGKLGLPANSTQEPRTLEEFFEMDEQRRNEQRIARGDDPADYIGYDPLPDPEAKEGINRHFAAAVLDDDDEDDRRTRVLFDEPGLAMNAERDRRLAKLGVPSRIKRVVLREPKAKR